MTITPATAASFKKNLYEKYPFSKLLNNWIIDIQKNTIKLTLSKNTNIKTKYTI